MTDYPGYVYSCLIAGGGVAGYVTAGSVMSLVMGLLFGVLAAAGEITFLMVNTHQYSLLIG